jgi:hypothetical protein
VPSEILPSIAMRSISAAIVPSEIPPARLHALLGYQIGALSC